jgi:hypothetical protein
VYKLLKKLQNAKRLVGGARYDGVTTSKGVNCVLIQISDNPDQQK